MDEKLAKILATTDFEEWRAGLWREISAEAIAHGWVERRDVREDGTVNPESARWGQLFLRLVCYTIPFLGESGRGGKGDTNRGGGEWQRRNISMRQG